ncbi:MAG: T9SS type A sorting domain-containing protein [Bacteroidota bacterium]
MKKLLLYFIIISLFSVCTNSSFAAVEKAGGEISYTCTSTPGIWHITLAVYTDCSSNGKLGNCTGACGSTCSYSLNITGADPNFNGILLGTVSVSLTNIIDVNMDPSCPIAKSNCNNMGCVTPGTEAGIEKYTFEGDADLRNSAGIPANCCNVKISYSEGLRSATISTGSTWQNFYIDCTINRCASMSPCNSSPIISNSAFAKICSGQPFVFNNGMIDPDHDSLTFSFTPALQALGQSVTYNLPFSFDAPMPYTGNKNGPFPTGISCDPLSGDIMFTPVYGVAGSTFVGVMAIEIKQWGYDVINNPILLGITHRDIQMWLVQCPPNNPPRLMTNPSNGNQPKTYWEIESGNTLCFDVIAKDTDFYPNNTPPISDTTDMTWNAALASKGATFLPKYNVAQRRVNGPREDIWQFCWTPTNAQASSLPYYFTVTEKDRRCPNPGKVTRSIAIKVLAYPSATIHKTYLGCNQWSLSYTNNNPAVPIIFSDFQIAKIPNDFSGTNMNTYLNTSTLPIQHFKIGGRYLVELDVHSIGPYGVGYLTKQYFDTLYADTGIVINVKDTAICNTSSVMINFNASWGHPPYSYRFFIAPDTITPINSNFNINNYFVTGVNKTTQYILQVRDTFGCRFYDSSIWIYHKPVLPVISGNTNVITGSYNFYSVTNNKQSTYNWLSGKGNILNGQGTNNIDVVFVDLGKDYLKVNEYSSTCVSDTASITIQVNGVGINETNTFEHFKLFPNPTKGILNIELTSLEKQVEIHVFDIEGSSVKSFQFENNKDIFKTEIDLSTITKGVYFIEIKSGNKAVQRKITLE